MLRLDIRIQEKKDANKPLFPEVAKAGYEEGKLESIGILEGGMQSGKASLMLNIKTDDGTYVIAEISADLFDGCASALRGARQRWGEI